MTTQPPAADRDRGGPATPICLTALRTPRVVRWPRLVAVPAAAR